MIIIALVGMPGSGKTALSKHLEEIGYQVIRFGHLLTEEVKKRGLPVTPQNETLLRKKIREELGMDAMAKIALPWLHDTLALHNTVVIEGIYSYSEYKTLYKEFGDCLITIAIVASKAKRYQRLAARKERPFTYTEAQERDKIEVEEIEKAQPIALADYSILNDTDDVGGFLQESVKLIAAIEEKGRFQAS